MYSKKIKYFSDKLFEYQKKIGFNTFVNLSDDALKKINLVAIEKLTHNSNLYEFNEICETDFSNVIKHWRVKCVIEIVVLFSLLLPFHLLLLIHKLFKSDKVNIGSSKILFFGSQSSTISNGYNLLSSIFPNTSFYALTGIVGIINSKIFSQKNTFTGFEANFISFSRSLIFIFCFISKFVKLNGLNLVNLKSLTLFFVEYIKILYSIEKSKLILKTTPKNSINIFMCDNNFFHTVHIDKLNSTKCITAIIQHGTFLEGNIVYLPVLSKWVLSCSERESKLFALSSSNTKIHTLGMPLQICLNDNINNITSNDYVFDLLILGRDGNQWEIESAYKVFENIGLIFKNKSILIRHHPKSNIKSKILLERKFSNFTLSLNSTLIQDILRAKIVISFSVDANIMCLLERKSIIFCGEPEAINSHELELSFENMKVVNSEKELINAILYFSNFENINNINYESSLVNIFGEYSIDKIKNNYIDFINQCHNEFAK